MRQKPIRRCAWAGNDPLMVRYHDREWGVPVRDDRKLFEFLVLEGMQAGLSWSTILKKRENYRTAFDNFNPEKIARYSEAKINKLMQNEGIIRNRLKIGAIIANANAYIEICQHHGHFADYIWDFVDGRPVRNRWKTIKELPAETYLSKTMSRDLKRNGFRFVGPTICYAFMQAVGMVNDHIIDCFRYKELLSADE
nr:DNA-3-methyladenine glycosylase I [candidate division Zixibacteria bacterium]